MSDGVGGGNARRLRVAGLLLVFAIVIAVLRLVLGDAPLSAALVAAPWIGAAIVVFSGCWLVPVLFAVVAAVLWIFQAWASRGPAHVVLVLPLLAQAWCAAGVGLVVGSIAVRVARLSRWWVRLPVLMGGTVLTAVLILPLTRIYRVQVIPENIDAIFAPGERFVLRGGDGVRLHCRFWSPDNPRGVVVFTHGVGGSHDEFVGIHLLFRRVGFAVLDWDLRGHGRSANAATTYGQREADDLVQVWAEARRRAGGRPVVAYGASLGGAATLLAAHRLDDCAGLIIESSFSELAPLIGPNLPGPLALSARSLARWGIGVDVDRLRPVDALARIAQVPLLLGTALDDRVIPPDHGLRLAAAAPWATHIAIEGRGHMDLAYDPRWMTALEAHLERAAREVPTSGLPDR